MESNDKEIKVVSHHSAPRYETSGAACFDIEIAETYTLKWMSGVSVDGLKHILDGAIEKHIRRAKLEGDPMTMPQAQYIQAICAALCVDFPGIMTKRDATEWLKVYVPKYKERIESESIVWEVNDSDIFEEG